MSDINKTISQFVENQFPALYRENGDVLVSFVKAYYEYLEENDHLINRDIFTIKDIDTTYDIFLSEFNKKYLEDFPFTASTDTRFLAKNILDIYRSKGSTESIELLFKLLFNEEATVYYPGNDVLRASDSEWITPTYIEVFSSSRSSSLINKKVFGSVSSASAFVDAIVTKRSNNRLIDILYLSDVKGTFLYGDIISDDGVLENAPEVIGSLSKVTLTETSGDPGNNSFGDKFNLVSKFGKNGVAAVSKISNATTGVTFELIDGGYGFTTDSSQIRISDLNIKRENSVGYFAKEETVTQRIERIALETGEGQDFFEAVAIGEQVTGTDGTNAVSGIVLNKGNAPFGNVIKRFIDVQPADEDTFTKKYTLNLTADTTYAEGDVLVGSNVQTVQIELVGTDVFQTGETVTQTSFFENDPNEEFLGIVTGVVTNISGNVLEIEGAFEEFKLGINIVGETSAATGVVVNSSVTQSSKTATVEEKISNSEYVVSSGDTFLSGELIRDIKHEAVSEISAVVNSGIIELNYESVTPVTNFDVTDISYKGTVLSTTQSAIKIYSEKNKFVFLPGVSTLTGESNMLVVDDIGKGSGASLKIGALENVETISLRDEPVNGKNVAGIPYLELPVIGGGTGVGHIETVNVTNGGSGYTNSSTVTITGGGYENQEPLLPAQATVTTSGGAITAIVITQKGGGYYSTPTITVSGGTGASFDIEMDYGYGFPKNPGASFDEVVADVLVENTYEIGTISRLDEKRPGQGYSVFPAVSLKNKTVSSYNRHDQLLTVDDATGFAVGETVFQTNTGARGIIESINNSDIKLKNISFYNYFTTDGGAVTNNNSGSTNIEKIVDLTSEKFTGENANIFNEIDLKNAAIQELRIVNSGFGYQEGETVDISNGEFSIKGTVSVSQQGIEPGYWKTRSSHLNSEKRLQDNDYYQTHSYDIKTSVNINSYRDIVLSILHVAGTKFFGSLVKNSVAKSRTVVTNEKSQI